jgi:hypothetical protein
MEFRQHPKLQSYNEAIQGDGKSPLFPSKGGSDGGSFTLLYYCFLLGVSSGERVDYDIPQDQEHWPHAVKAWPAVFSQWRYLIINLLLVGYATEMNYSVEHKTFSKLLSNVVDSNDTNNLTNQGYLRFNQYAYRGFEILNEMHPFPVNGSETFIKINDKLQENFSKTPWV